MRGLLKLMLDVSDRDRARAPDSSFDRVRADARAPGGDLEED